MNRKYFHFYIVDDEGSTLSFYDDAVSISTVKDSNLKYDLFSQAVEVMNAIEFGLNDLTIMGENVKLPLRIDYKMTKITDVLGITSKTIESIEKIYEHIKDEFATDLDELLGAWKWFTALTYGGKNDYMDFTHEDCIERFVKTKGLAEYREFLIEEEGL